MKKVIIATVVALTLMAGITSCKKEQSRCYKTVTRYTWLDAGDTVTVTNHTWATSVDNAIAEVGANIAIGMVGFKIVDQQVTEATEFTTEEDCKAQDKKEKASAE